MNILSVGAESADISYIQTANYKSWLIPTRDERTAPTVGGDFQFSTLSVTAIAVHGQQFCVHASPQVRVKLNSPLFIKQNNQVKMEVSTALGGRL
jgi:hypothetical protein